MSALGKRLIAGLAGLALLAPAGCHDMFDLPAWVPGGGPVSDQVPGVITPGQRLARLRRLADEAAWRNRGDRQTIARDLAAAYGEETDDALRAEIVRVLSKYSGPEADDVLKRAVKDPAADVRWAACEGLERCGGPQSTAVLAELLGSDTDPDVRKAAARALRNSKDPAAVAALGRALDDPDPAMQHRAVLALRGATGQDFGNDVNQWRQYVKGETPKPAKPISIAERLRSWF